MGVVRCLLLEVAGLEPVGKYLLVRLWDLYQAEGSFVSTVKALSKSFGVKSTCVTKALTHLHAQGLLTIEPVPSGRGYPQRRFTFTKRLASLLSKVMVPKGHKPVLCVESFLRSERGASEDDVVRPDWVDGVLFEKVKRGKLSVTNRLLVAVMLAKADRFGVVSSLGLSEMRRATGLSNDRLTYRLSRLLAIGVIRFCVHGATGRHLLGVTRSVYGLNLADPELSSLGLKPTVYVKSLDRKKFAGWPSLLGDVYSAANQPSFRLAVRDPELESLKRLTLVQAYFDPADRNRLSPALELRLLLYASALLSSHWDLIPDSSGRFQIQDVESMHPLHAKFQAEFGPPKRVASELLSEDRLGVLHTCLWEAVCRKASEVKSELSSFGLSRGGKHDYLVMPHGLEWGFLTVLELPKGEAGNAGCYLWQDGNRPKRYPSELHIPISDRLDYGLLSRPKRRFCGSDQ